MMKCYLKNEETAPKVIMDEEHWFNTGDMGSMNAEGYFEFWGRKDDLIFVEAGTNQPLEVYPVEVERWVNRYHKVKESAVVGVPNEKTNE